jgi:hypothetical protein
MKLYRKWMSSGAPTLMLLADPQNNALVASVILSLKKTAFRDYWYNQMDALDIDGSHLLSGNDKPSCQYLLIDMLASHKGYIRQLSAEKREQLRGIGFRAMIRHIAEFSPIDKKFEPILFCSTLDPSLRSILPSIGFETKTGQSGAFPIFRADLSREDWYSDDAERLIEAFFSNIACYINVPDGTSRSAGTTS